MTEATWTQRLFGGMRRTSEKLGENLGSLTSGGTTLDAQTLDDVEDALIASDLGPATAKVIRDRLADTKFERGVDAQGVRAVMADEIAQILRPVAKPLEIDAFPRPQVILVIGVNGSGKTTTIAKIAHYFLEQDYGVMLAAGDTFRAAAIGQLKVWAERLGVPIVSGPEGGDAAGIVFDAVKLATATGIDVLIVDPFVSSHGVSENNNGAIDAIAKKWARVGVQANCSIVLVHHTKKLNGGEATADAARGASALPNAARSVVALNRMSHEEATQWGIEGDDRRRYFRAYDDKNNRAPPASRSDWYQLVSVDLGNGPDGTGDNMQVVVPWSPPDAFTGVTTAHLIRVQDAVRGGSWRADPQSEDWVGIAVAEVLNLDVSDRRGTDAARIKQMLKLWGQTGVLKKETRRCDKTRRDKPFIVCGEAVQP